MTTRRIDITHARTLAVIAQGLDRRPRGKVTAARVLETIERIGCVQLDTISVVARSHETALFSRLGPFDPDLVWSLYGQPDGLAEYWAHAAAIVPARMLPLFRRKMLQKAEEYSQPGGWRETLGAVEAQVLEAIRTGGPKMSRHFDGPEGGKAGPWVWYGGKPAKEALDMLWTAGELTVIDRVGFQRVYDLTERALPGVFAGDLPDEATVRREFARRALRALGLATPGWLADYFRTGQRHYLNVATSKRELAAMEADGEAIPVAVDGIAAPLWLDPGMLETLAEVEAGGLKPTLTTLLSPFDNLVWQRSRTRDLFDFDYQLEIYVVTHKRKWGYYTMPILHRGRMVGRLDPQYDRKARVLTVRAVYLEPWQRPTASLAAAVAGALREYTTQLGGGTVVVERGEPEGFAEQVRTALGPE
jgi:uncharacterized protein YcaQ